MHGGKREGAGRPAGMPNKATIEQGARLAELAKSYSDIAFNTIVDVAINGTSDSARIAAADRPALSYKPLCAFKQVYLR